MNASSPRLTVPPSSLDEFCSQHFRWRDLVECGATWHFLASQDKPCDNLPKQLDTWMGIQQIAVQLLDPLADRFGPIELTYAFAGSALTRHIPGKIAPQLDQHAGSELRKDGRLICPRRGQAVDFRLSNTSASEVVQFIVAELPFDRLYFYGDDRPLHLSFGPDNTRAAVEMWQRPSRRLIPRRLNAGQKML